MMIVPRETMPPDPLAAARGIKNAALMSAVIWLAAAAVCAWLGAYFG